jgi:predicted kinase
MESRATLYSPEHTERTHRECLRRAEELLFVGKRVIVDATFREERRRRFFLDAAVRLGLPVAMLVCAASPDTIRERLAVRKGDASDADWSTYLQLSGEWEESGSELIRVEYMIVTDGTLGHELGAALGALGELGLYGR